MISVAPRVSVIVAAYNLEGFIEKSIGSVLSQTFGDFEILICDDCSTDGTYGVLQKLEGRDPRIRLLHNEINMGQAFARNRCFESAKGEYFAIHDGDDLSMPNRLESQVGFLDSHPEYAFVSGLIRTFDDSGALSENLRGKAGEVKKRDFLWGMPISHPTTMFRGEGIKKAGGYTVLKTTRFRNEDYDLVMRMYAMGMKGWVLNEHVCNYYEGTQAYKRRKYRYRWAEVKVRYKNFKALGLMPIGLIYAIKPMIVGLMPQTLLKKLREKRAKKK